MNEKREFILSIFFAGVLFFITMCIVQRQVGMGSGDYVEHGNAALSINSGNFFQKFMEDPHCLWHIPVKLCCALFKTGELGYVAGGVTGFFIIATYILTIKYMQSFCNTGVSIMAFITCIVGPLYIPWINSNYYLGTGTPNTWHNPTNIAVKPFAVIIFTIICSLFSVMDSGKDVKLYNPPKRIILVILSILILFSVIAKPSFVMAFIPALGLFFVIRLLTGDFKNISIFLTIGLSFLPGVLVLIFQYFTFFGSETEAGIAVGWYRVTSIWTSHPFFSSILAIAFPLCFILFNIKREIKRVDTQLSILYYCVGGMMANLLYETGPREAHGNMGWAGLLALYILWMVTLSHFLADVIDFDMKDRIARIKNGIMMALLSIHFLYGTKYVIDLLTVEGKYY